MLDFLKNENITYEMYRGRFVKGLCTTIALLFVFSLNLLSRIFVLQLAILLAYILSVIFTLYNLYRAILAGIGVYDFKGLLMVFKKLIDKLG